MCGRFTLTKSAEAIAEAFELDEIPRFTPGYNIAPSQPVPVVRLNAKRQRPEFDYLYWGLIPSWSKDVAIGAKLINARSETVTEKASFRTAFKRRRCLIVADGFYEWQKSDGKKQGSKKQPYYFHLADHQLFAFAGLWEYWQSAEGDEIQSCTILTTEANDAMRSIHDRMPVILEKSNYDLWLDPSIQTSDRLMPLLHPYPNEELHFYPVGLQVNSPKNDNPACIEPLPEVSSADRE